MRLADNSGQRNHSVRVDPGGISLYNSAGARTHHHQVVAGWALRPSQMTAQKVMPLGFTTAVGTPDYLYHLHFDTS